MKKLLLLIFLTVISCAPIPSTTKFTDKNVSIEKNNVNVGLIVNCSKLQLLGYFDTYCNNFTLVIQNKNNQNIEVNWNKSFYISNGQSNGGFMYGGITYLLRNAPKQNDIIFANNNFSKIIYPINLVEFSNGSWKHLEFPLSEIGIYLTLLIDKKEVDYKLTNIIKIKKEIL